MPDTPFDCTQAHDIEAEQRLLGAILVNNEAFDRVSDFLQPNHFSEELHRRIYEVCAQLIGAGKLATVITLRTFLAGIKLPGGVTVQAYLAHLAVEATTITNAEALGRMIYDFAARPTGSIVDEGLTVPEFKYPENGDAALANDNHARKIL